jgi:hypothetical protein
MAERKLEDGIKLPENEADTVAPALHVSGGLEKEQIITWDGDMDDQNPLNWSLAKKRY